MALINCPYCGNQVSDKAETCVHCGKTLIKGSDEKHCEECGTVLSEEDKVCPKCGCPVVDRNIDQKPVEIEKKVTKEQKNEKNKYIIPIVAIVAILIISLLAGHKTGNSGGSNDEGEQKQETQVKAESFEEKAIKQLCSTWEFGVVSYLDKDGNSRTLTKSDFGDSPLPEFVAKEDGTYILRLVNDEKYEGNWTVVSESICKGMENTEYAYNLSTDEDSPNKDSIVVMAFINTEDIEENGYAHKLSVGFTVDGVARIAYVFTK